jgi:UDP-N-acetyl-D-mannosaminuronic acid transferase (WecB/TagA/CpsF family)
LIILGPIWLIAGMFLGYFPGSEPKEIIIPIATLFAAVVAVGLFVVTKPAFK